MKPRESTHCLSGFAVDEEGVRGGDQNWSLLPFCGTMTVKASFHGGGEKIDLSCLDFQSSRFG